MKRNLLILFIIFIVMQFIQPNRQNIAVEKNLEIKAPPEIMTLLKTSCFDCHSNETTWPWYSQVSPFSWVVANHVNTGRQALNLSTWENYSPEKKEEKLKVKENANKLGLDMSNYIRLIALKGDN